MITDDKIAAPFTPAQVASLNGFQESGVFHPFTCGGEKCRNDLVAKEDGWHCPSPECDYRQNWAHAFMANWSWLAQHMHNRLRSLPAEALQKVWELIRTQAG